jgi:hypothetical protein
MIKFEVKVYPGTNSEKLATVRIGEQQELWPDSNTGVVSGNAELMGYDIDVYHIPGNSAKFCGTSAHLLTNDIHLATAQAMLEIASYGNGGFNLAPKYLK